MRQKIQHGNTKYSKHLHIDTNIHKNIHRIYIKRNKSAHRPSLRVSEGLIYQVK